MNSKPGPTQAARDLLAELSRLRATAGRAETLAKLKLLVAEPDGANGAAPIEQPDTRRPALEAIAALKAAYERPELVPDRLWAEAVNRTVDWVRLLESH